MQSILRKLWLGMAALLVVAGASAQTAVTTSGGSSGSIPVFNGSSSVSDSLLTQANSAVGIANSPSTPGERFTVMSDFNSVPTVYWGYDTTTANAPVGMGKVPYLEIVGEDNGNESASIGLVQLGINQTGAFLGPASLDLAATRAATASAAGDSPVGNGDLLGIIKFIGDDGTSMASQGADINAQVYTAHSSVSANNVPAALNLATHGAAPIVFYTQVPGNSGEAIGGPYERMRISYSGNVGIGTTSPTAKLEVDGNIKLTSGSGASITFPDGTVQSTAYTGVACGGDYAEQVNVTGDRKHFMPGDVLVVDPSHPGQFLKSATPYSTAVAGVYSTKPGFVGHAVGMPKTQNQVPMAMLGIVPTKVTAVNGPIHPGDLLVTSSKIGYAMKATDRSRLTGAVIGKALGNLNSGTGKIEVLVTLQ